MSCSTSSSSQARPAPLTAPSLTGYVTPASRFGASLAYDDATLTTILFGGANSSGVLFKDTWEYQSAPAGPWKKLAPTCSPSCPSARHDAAMAFDKIDNYLVMFGGCTVVPPGWIQSTPGCDSTHFLGDTWKFVGGVSPAWTKITPTCSPTCPSARYAAGMAPSGGVILYGGCGTACPLSDVYKYLGGTWTPLTVSSCGLGCPAPRYGTGMIYDAIDGYILVFGGCSSSARGCPNANILGDTLELNGPLGVWSWTKVTVTCSPCPGPRYYPAMTNHNGTLRPTAEQMIAGVGLGGTILSDEWSYGTGAWTGLTPPATFSPRYDGKWADGDPLASDGYSVLFGGSSPTGSSLGDTWAAGSGGITLASQEQSPISVPYPRFGASMAYDANSADGYVLLFGGCGSNSSCAFSDTWEYLAGKWTQVTASFCTSLTICPAGRYNASMAYDSSAQDIVLFGGYGSSGLLQDTWTFTGGTGWVAVIGGPATTHCSGTTCPSSRFGAGLAYDAGGSTVVLFGGCGSTCPLGDTWKFTGTAWTQLTPTCTPTSSCPVPKRYGAAMATDPNANANYILMFGGRGTGTKVLGDSWSFVGGATPTWTLLTPATPPSARSGAAMIYDSTDALIVLFGGCDSASCPLADTYTFSGATGGAWTKITCTTGCPSGRTNAVFADDPPDSYTLMFGGWTPSFPGPVPATGTWSDSWAYGGGGWTMVPIPNQMPQVQSIPPRYGASMVFDPGVGKVLLFGGCGLYCGMGDTWTFANGGWVESPCTGSCPSPRWDAAMTFFTGRGSVLMYGGVGLGGPPLSDAWAWGGSWSLLCSACSPGGRAGAML
ncbi:MAG: hypothetical protein L3K07_07530, partial [Thermoplasmata archaeon]|nr:hypothetical protein [Thermoplasmata archaeon]